MSRIAPRDVQPYVRSVISTEQLEPRMLLACEPLLGASVVASQEGQPFADLAPPRVGFDETNRVLRHPDGNGDSDCPRSAVEEYVIDAIIDSLQEESVVSTQSLVGQNNSAYRQYISDKEAGRRNELRDGSSAGAGWTIPAAATGARPSWLSSTPLPAPGHPCGRGRRRMPTSAGG